MAENTLVAEPRVPSGSRAAGRLRAEDRIPGVVYGQGSEPIPITVTRRDLRIALSGPAGHNAILQLKVGDGRPRPAILKELQRHPVRRTVQHVDFLLVNMNEEIEVDVPLALVGESKQVKDVAGLIDPAMNSIKVTAKPGAIPTEIPVDISGLAVGESIRVGDLTFPDGVTCHLDPDIVVVSAIPSRATLQMQQGEAAPAEGVEEEA